MDFCRQKVPEGKAATIKAFVIKGSKVEGAGCAFCQRVREPGDVLEMEEFYGI